MVGGEVATAIPSMITPMNRPREPLLADTGLPQQQKGGVGAGYAAAQINRTLQ